MKKEKIFKEKIKKWAKEKFAEEVREEARENFHRHSIDTLAAEEQRDFDAFINNLWKVDINTKAPEYFLGFWDQIQNLSEGEKIAVEFPFGNEAFELVKYHQEKMHKSVMDGFYKVDINTKAPEYFLGFWDQIQNLSEGEKIAVEFPFGNEDPVSFYKKPTKETKKKLRGCVSLLKNEIKELKEEAGRQCTILLDLEKENAELRGAMFRLEIASNHKRLMIVGLVKENDRLKKRTPLSIHKDLLSENKILKSKLTKLGCSGCVHENEGTEKCQGCVDFGNKIAKV